MLIVGEDLRNVGRRKEGEAEAIGGVGGLLEGLAAESEVLGVERAIAAVPEERAVGLVGFEVAEVACHAAATATAASTESAAAPESTTSTRSTATAGTARTSGTAAERVIQLGTVAHLAEVDAGERIGGAHLSADGDGFA